MDNYKLVVYEGNSKSTKLMLFKNGLWNSLLILNPSKSDIELDGDLTEGWMTYPKDLNKTEELLRDMLVHNPSNNYKVLEEWSE